MEEIEIIIEDDKIRRPKWTDVYNGYPKIKKNTGATDEYEDDEPSEDIFKSILGETYYYEHKTKFSNACATRVSIALNKAGMNVKKDFLIQQGDLKGKGFIGSAKNLQGWLSRSTVWGEEDVKVEGPNGPGASKSLPINTLSDVAKKIDGKNGVYIILGGFSPPITGHATLWIGANNDVIGGHNYIDYGGTVYFWELK